MTIDENSEIIEQIKKEPMMDYLRLKSMPLAQKVEHSLNRIREWYEWNNGKVYVSFSGGKDSLVLLHLIRSIYPDVLAVYCNTGVDYPSIVKYVKTFDNVKILYPKKHFMQIVREHGVVYPSKIVAQIVNDAKNGKRYAIHYINGEHKDGTENKYKSQYKKWKWLLDCDVKISDVCCDILKEKPAREFEKTTGLKPYIGIRADESQRRKEAWLKNGCNYYGSRPVSKPLSLWSEQDVLEYIIAHRLPLCEEYGDIKMNSKGKLYTTGENRTGCMWCAIPLRYEPEKLDRIKQKYPKLYDTFAVKHGLLEIYKKLKIIKE